jgi:hypothetical protein
VQVEDSESEEEEEEILLPVAVVEIGHRFANHPVKFLKI